MEEEYTDYSCSTAVERLSRDVETVLRAWHVDKGSDHHVSVATAAAAATTTTIGSGTSVELLPQQHQHQQQEHSAFVSPLIRSNTLIWHVPVTTRTGRSTVTVDLELALWDDPQALAKGESELLSTMADEPSASAATATPTFSSNHSNNNALLVRSLQRKGDHLQQMPTHNIWFDNFSLLFGIGQHISLSPIQSHPIPHDLVEFLGSTIVERHDDATTAPFVIGSTLSGWLQTALNTAVANCHCAIPAIGVWGTYKPNENSYTTTTPTTSTVPMTHLHSNGTKMSMSGPVTKEEWSLHSVTGSHPHNQNSMNHTLVGKTIQTLPDTTSLEKNALSTTTTTTTTTTSSSSSVLPISAFPKWAHAIRSIHLPPVARSYRRQAKTQFWNQRHIPPLLCGTVSSSFSTPIDAPAIGATLWVAAAASTDHFHSGHLTMSTTSAPTTATTTTIMERTCSSSRLSIWGSVLLQHCPEESSCVLNGARHVYAWFKPRLPTNTGILPIIASSLFGGKDPGSGNGSSMNSASLQNNFNNNNNKNALLQEWRLMNTVLSNTPKPDQTDFEIYRKHCHAYFLDLLEEAWCPSSNARPRGHQGTTAGIYPPVWGPIDDPVASVWATTTWNGKPSHSQQRINGGSSNNNNNNNNKIIVEPLLSLPFRIRSRRKLSSRDWVEMEESVEKSILDPLQPSRFVVQVHFDRETSVATLAANQRCILATLIRSATLPGETLLGHITDAQLVELWDDHAGTIVANKLAEKSKVGSRTMAIVDAMDWSNVMADMISVREAEEIVHHVMKGELMAGYPSAPETGSSTFLESNDLCFPFRKAAPFGRLLSLLFAHMAKVRALSSMSLIWGVFVQELRRRWETREALPNMQYVPGLDPHPLELGKNRFFSSLGHKAEFSGFLNCSEPDPDDYQCLIGQKLQVFNIAVECIVAREILEHEVMERFLEQGEVPTTAKLPDMEASNASEATPSVERTIGEDDRMRFGRDTMQHDPLPVKRKWPKSRHTKSTPSPQTPPRRHSTSFALPDPNAERTDYGPPAINSDLEFWVMDEPGYAPRDEGRHFTPHATDDTGFDFVAQAPPDLDDIDGDASTLYQRRSSVVIDGMANLDVNGWEGRIMEGDMDEDDDDDEDESGNSAASRKTSGSLSQAYFDTAEAGSIFSMRHGFVSMDTVVNSADLKRRPGARCPVQGITLHGTGDQLYAPYLQRPSPLTDDLILERKHMLASEQREGERRSAVLTARIDLAHRLQLPKLKSDMSAFKAANPNATIDDFAKWYGNPGSPLDDYEDEQQPWQDDDASTSDAYYEAAAKKLDRAAEAMKILTATRDFWATTWERASPVPAAEQHPLFDFESTGEMAIDFLEQMHPANLVNQVMAVNLASSFFVLVSSAEDALNIDLIQTSISKLRQKIERALQLLSDDATGTLFQVSNDSTTSTSTATANQYISTESIYACEEACNALSVTETLLARAVSLLSKFPSQYRLVQELLRLSDGTTVALIDPVGRKCLLEAIQQQQQQQQQRQKSTAMTNSSNEKMPKPMIREYVLRNLNDEKPCQLSVRFGDPDVYVENVGGECGGVVLALLKSYMD